jgi:chromosome segregation ATPase
MRELHEEQLFVSQSDNLLATSLAAFYRRTCDELSAAYLTINTELDRESLASRDLRVQLSGALEGKETLEAEFAKVQEERNNLSNELATAARITDELRISAAKAEQQSAEIERKLIATTRASEAAASNNKKVVQQLTETVKKSRMAEEGLRAEIEMCVDAFFILFWH